MRRTLIYLDEDQNEQLERLAEQEHVSRAELIRRLLSRALAGTDHDVEVDCAAIEGSFGVLADATAFERRRDERDEHLDRIRRVGE
jgi:metal-responsive CopG/Arc/MetJ family transcriptional regulator